MARRAVFAGARDAAPGLGRGSNQVGVRLYNERLVLSIVRHKQSLAKAEIARETGLTPQTISVIINQLTSDGLLLRGTPQRGRIGQPSVPYSLNPDGAYSFGLKIGRRSVDLYLINFTGDILDLLHETYRYPMPDDIREFTKKGIEKLLAGQPALVAEKLTGLGIAAPYEIWTWPEELGAPREAIEVWRTVNIREEIAAICAVPVYFGNDITAACAAELMFGGGGDYVDYLYVFVGSFVGGGLVLDGHVFPGRHQNAGAIGSMLAFGAPPRPDGLPQQLMNVASIYTLEHRLEAENRDSEILWRSPDHWGALGAALDIWINEVATALAYACVNALSVIDVPTVIIDGAFPAEVRSRLVERTRAVLDKANTQGLVPFEVIEGTIGNAARALGGATLPLLANFSRDREVLFKESP